MHVRFERPSVSGCQLGKLPRLDLLRNWCPCVVFSRKEVSAAKHYGRIYRSSVEITLSPKNLAMKLGNA